MAPTMVLVVTASIEEAYAGAPPPRNCKDLQHGRCRNDAGREAALDRCSRGV